MELVQEILSKELFLIYLIGVMITVGVIKEYNLFHLQFLSKIKDKRIAVVLFSFFAGILPVPGRVTVSAGLLDTIATKNPEKKKVFGILDYLATHHFYFWSPLEKTVILPMAALGLSWTGWMHYFWLPLIIYILFLIWFIYTQVDADAIELNFPNNFILKEFILYTLPLFVSIGVAIFISPIIVFGILALYYIFILTKKEYFSSKIEILQKLNKYINWKLVILLAVLLPIAALAEEAVEHYNFQPTETILIITTLAIFALTLISGEEDVYAALNAVAVPIFGINYLPLLWFSGYFAYSLSPLHKCIWISTGYFGTPIKNYYKVISYLIGLLSLYLVVFYIFN